MGGITLPEIRAAHEVAGVWMDLVKQGDIEITGPKPNRMPPGMIEESDFVLKGAH